MKGLILSLTALLSLSASAYESIYIACLNPEMDKTTYNASFETNAERLVGYTIDTYDGLQEIEITLEEREVGPVYIQWGAWDDTNYGYIVNNHKDLVKEWKVTNWTSGNDADNYEAVTNDLPVECHQLNKKPTDLKVDFSNIARKI